MALNDPVPSKAFDVLQRNMEDADLFVNGNVNPTFINRVGDTIRTLLGVNKYATESISTAISSAGYHIVGDFADAAKVTISNENEVYTSKSVVGFEGYVWRTNQSLPYTPTGSDPGAAPEAGKWLAVAIGELQTIARSLNVLDSQIIYSTDTTTPIGDGDGVDYIYDASQQLTYKIPAGVGAGETIVSVVGNQLTTNITTYTLISVTHLSQESADLRYFVAFDSVSDMQAGTPSDGKSITFEVGMRLTTGETKWKVTASGGIALTGGLTAIALNRINVTDFGAIGDGVTDDNQAFTDARAVSVNVYLPTPSVSYLVSTNQAGNFYSDHAVIFSGSGLVTFTDLSKPRKAFDIRCIAHRGYTGAVAQNTLTGVSRAIRNGADLAEVDVQITSDGTPILFHDATLDALTDGTGAVSANTFATINSLAYDSLVGTPLATTRIPTLAVTLDLLASYRKGCVIEIKEYRTDDDIDLILAAIDTAGIVELTYILVNSVSDLERVRSSSDPIGQQVKIMIAYADQTTWLASFNHAKALGGEYEITMYHQNIRGGGAGMVNEINLYSRLSAYWLVHNGTTDSDSGQQALDMQRLGVTSLTSDQNIKIEGS